MRDFILFYIGAMLGSAIGVTAMCLFQINRDEEERLYYRSTAPDGCACKKTKKAVVRRMPMKNRKAEIKVRLSEKEAENLNRNVRRCGLSRESYLRHLINGYIPREAPPLDYYELMRLLYQIGNNLNQIAAKAHTLRVMDAQRYDTEIRKLDAVIRMMTAAVVSPQRMGKAQRMVATDVDARIASRPVSSASGHDTRQESGA